MKPVHLLLASAICLSCLVPLGHAQELPREVSPANLITNTIKPAVEPSKLDLMLVQKGALITEGFTDVGNFQGNDGATVRVRAVQVSDDSDNHVFYGVVVQVQLRGRTAKSYIDLDKLDGLIKLIDTLRTMDRSATQMADFEASYRMPGGLEIQNASRNGVRAGEIRCIQIHYSTGSLTWAEAAMPLSQLEEFKNLLTSARQKISAAEQARDHGH